jgi:hypothetical protein
MSKATELRDAARILKINTPGFWATAARLAAEEDDDDGEDEVLH